TDITVHPKALTSSNDMRSLSEGLTSIKGIEKVSPVATFTVLKNSSNLGRIPTNIILFGMKPELHPDFSRLKLTSGNREISSDEVLISKTIADELNIKSGDELLLPEIDQFDYGRVNVTIQGVIDDKSIFGNYLGSFFILIDFDYLIGLFNSDLFLNYHLDVMVKDFMTVNTVAEEIQDLVGLEYSVYRENAISETDILAIRSYQTAMVLIMIVSIIVEFLFILNVLSMNIRERAKEFGILRAIGSSNRQIVFSLSIEMLMYAGIASFLGILSGIAFSFIPLFVLNFYFTTIQIDLVIIKPASIILAYISGILITLISGLYPMFRAISLPVIQNIHMKAGKKKGQSRYWLYSTMTGAVLIASGFLIINSISSVTFLTFEIFSLPFLAIGVIFFGFVILETGFIRFVPTIGEKLMIWHGYVPRIIATRNIRRETQKSTITTIMTGLALSFILILGITSAGIIQSVPAYYEERYGRIDIIADTTDSAQVSLSFVDELVENNTSVERAEFMQQQRTTIGSIEGYVLGINATSYEYFFNETMISPLDSDIPLLLNTTDRGTIVSDILLNLIGGRIGENLTIKISSNTSINLKITGIAAGNPFLQDGRYLYISNDLFRTYWSNNSANWFIMQLTADSETAIVANQLGGKYPSLNEIIPVDYYARIIENTLMMMSVFFQVLMIYTFFIAALTQFLSILMSDLNMEREIGILRAMGLTSSQAFQTLLVESTLLVAAGVAIGIFNGLIGSELLAWYSIEIQTSVSVDFIALWVLLTIIIPVVSTEYISRRSLKRQIAYAINTEIPREQKIPPKMWQDWDTVQGFQHLE
ncbi:MAG: ABC transporter permease, partial [Candidatus Hodarchaeales archaeon]